MGTRIVGPLPQGKTHTLIDESVVASGVTSKEFTLDTEAILVSVWVESISGTLDISVYTFDAAGQEAEIITFPQLSTASSQLLLRKSSVALANVRVQATYSAAAEYRITVKGISSSSGDTKIKIAGSNDGRNTQTDVGGVATQIIPAALTDRQGLIVRNWSEGEVLYIAFSAAEATVALGYPLLAREQMAIDVEAGVELWGISGGGTVDTRVVEAGA